MLIKNRVMNFFFEINENIRYDGISKRLKEFLSKNKMNLCNFDL